MSNESIENKLKDSNVLKDLEFNFSSHPRL